MYTICDFLEVYSRAVTIAISLWCRVEQLVDSGRSMRRTGEPDTVRK